MNAGRNWQPSRKAFCAASCSEMCSCKLQHRCTFSHCHCSAPCCLHLLFLQPWEMVEDLHSQTYWTTQGWTWLDLAHAAHTFILGIPPACIMQSLIIVHAYAFNIRGGQGGGLRGRIVIALIVLREKSAVLCVSVKWLEDAWDSCKMRESWEVCILYLRHGSSS